MSSVEFSKGEFIKGYSLKNKDVNDKWIFTENDLSKLLQVFANEYANCFDGEGKSLLKERDIHLALKRHCKTIEEY